MKDDGFIRDDVRATHKVTVVIDVAQVLKECSTIDGALRYLRGVNDIFVEGEVRS